MSQRWASTPPGAGPRLVVNAAAGTETVTLGPSAVGVVTTVEREDSSTNTVTVAVAVGLSLDGTPTGATTVGPNSSKDFRMKDGGYESSGVDASLLLPRAEGNSTYGRKTTISSASPFSAPTKIGTTFTAAVMGYDATDGRIFLRDTTNGQLKQSADYGTSLSTNKTTPSDVTATNCSKIVRFGANLYLQAKATTGSVTGVYSAAPAAGNTAFTWSSPLMTFTSGASGLGPGLDASNWGANDYLYVGEYGDPTGGPSIYRSADGTTWERTFGPDASLRHCHSVKADPYNPGHVWATMGDGTAKTILRSTDYGATWSVAVVSSAWQGVQISFSTDWVFIAGDSMRGTVLVIDRATNTPYMASSNYHGSMPVPGGRAGRKFTDASITSGSATLGSAAGAAFTSDDIGAYVSGPLGIPGGTYITAVGSGTSATMSANATVTASSQTVAITGDVWFANAYYGAVDPATGVYYCVANDTSNAGNTQGLFCLPRVGGRIEHLFTGGAAVGLNLEVFIVPGYVISGNWRRPLLTIAP